MRVIHCDICEAEIPDSAHSWRVTITHVLAREPERRHPRQTVDVCQSCVGRIAAVHDALRPASRPVPLAAPGRPIGVG